MSLSKKFEQEFKEKLAAGGYVYETNAALKSTHYFGSMGGPVWYPQGVIYRKSQARIKGTPTLRFCIPNQPTSLRDADAFLYADKRLIETLLLNRIQNFCVANNTYLSYGLMATHGGSVINDESLEFALSPEDARRYQHVLAIHVTAEIWKKLQSHVDSHGQERRRVRFPSSSTEHVVELI